AARGGSAARQAEHGGDDPGSLPRRPEHCPCSFAHSSPEKVRVLRAPFYSLGGRRGFFACSFWPGVGSFGPPGGASPGLLPQPMTATNAASKKSSMSFCMRMACSEFTELTGPLN